MRISDCERMSIAFVYSSNSQFGIWYVFAASCITPAFIICEGAEGGDRGDRSNVGLIFSPWKIIRKTLVLLRGRESRVT